MSRGKVSNLLLKVKITKEIFFLALLLLSAFVIRIQPALQGLISFHYDMSRDAFTIEQIWKNFDLKILGPPTSTPGLYHGVLYYYLLAPLYLLGRGDPVYPSVFLAFLNSMAILPIYFLSKNLFKSKLWGIVSVLFFIVSFEAIEYGSWLSNPEPAVLTTASFFYFLYSWILGDKRGLYFSVIFAALSTQFQFFLIYLFFIIFLVGYFYKIRVSLKDLIICTLLTLVVLSSFIVSIIKFGSVNQLLSGFLGISTSKGIATVKFSDLFFEYLNSYVNLFTNNFFPSNVFVGGIIAFFATTLSYKKGQYFILLGLLSSLLIFIFGGHSSVYSNIGLVTPAILAMTFLIKEIGQFDKRLVAAILLFMITSNFYEVMANFTKGQMLLVIPKEMILKNELKVVDKTYELSSGRQFSINTLTLPLWTNTTWVYLYHYYGQRKYGYLPKFYGRDQVGLLGADVLERVASPSAISFYIIEPLNGIPEKFVASENSLEDTRTELLKEYNFDGIILQQRKPKEIE